MIREIVKTYTANWYGNLAPAAARDCQFRIVNEGRQIALSSIIINLELYPAPVGSGIIPMEQNDVFRHYLVVCPDEPGVLQSSPFTAMVGVIDFFWNEFRLTRPGQYFFDKLFAWNRLDFTLHLHNQDPIRTISYHYCLVASIK